ncbi:MAG TPA: glycosyltransferase [Pyrinomonadaceae bacterium]|nr:glycosyltransferase [Pyrinomonadaceae bacterium]
MLVLTLSFGSGHVRAAEVVARELAQQAPGAEVRVVDALADCRALFRAFYMWPYWAMVRYAPALWARFFAARVARKDEQTAPVWALRWGCAQVFKTIAELKPEVIVAAEVAACELAVIAKREGLTDARIVSVITDHEAEPVWVKPEVAAFAVADEQVREQLCAWGAQAEKIFVCGIPTDPAFDAQHDRQATRARHGLTDAAPVVLLMGGGMGPTHMYEVAAHLCASNEPMQLIAITGHDARARRRLERVRAVPHVSLHVLGWVETVAALMQTAAVLVTKPVGLTLAEAALCALPVITFDAIPGPEQRNAARVVANGAGVLTNDAQETAAATLALLRDEHLRRRMSACAARLAHPQATAAIARLALADLRTPERIARRTTA